MAGQTAIDPPSRSVLNLPVDERDRVMERAAIYEFDAGMWRNEAMKLAIRDQER